MRRYTAIVLGFLVSGCASAAVPVSAQEPPPEPARAPLRTLDVSAQAAVSRAPDQAVVRLGVETTARTARMATQANAEAMGAVMAALDRLGIPSSAIRTESIGLSPRYQRNPDGSEPIITGYQATNQVSVRVGDIDRLGPVVDASIEAGANRVMGIQFEIADPESAYHEALELAVAKARSEAETLARAMGETLGPAIHVSTGGVRAPVSRGPMPEMVRFEAAATPVSAGELEVSAVVNITYRLGP
jgi:uncharacterized protein YggE